MIVNARISKNQIYGIGVLFIILGLISFIKTKPVQCGAIDLVSGKIFEFYLDSTKEKSLLANCLKHHNTPGLGIALIQNGELSFATGIGTLSTEEKTPVNANTVFSVGSVSKVVNAVLILRLVDKGLLDLDVDVNNYLKSWKLKENKFTSANKITLRHLLTHTAGLTVHGFPDFYPGEKLPTVIETLEGKKPAKTKAVKSIFTPGTKMKYSGGGITVSQLVVTDITGLSYPEAAEKYVFIPLGMKRSTFVNPLPKTHGNIAKAHDRAGKLTAKPRGYQAMPEMAASGLWTSANDLAKLMKALIKSYHSESNFLKKQTIKDMMTVVELSNSQKNIPYGPTKETGLGVFLRKVGKEEILFSHNGSNESYKALIKGWLEKKNGLILLSNGASAKPLIRMLAKQMTNRFQLNEK